MAAPISVIIPTLNAAAGLKRSLPPLMEGLTEGLINAVIFADGGSIDSIETIAEEIGAELVSTAPGRGVQLAAGCASARSDWLLVLHADTVLPVGWSDHAKRALMNPNQAHVFHLSFDTAGFAPNFVAGWANTRTKWFGLPYGDQALLISRQLYRKIGGYPEIPLMEDAAIARALRGKISIIDATVTTSADRYQRDGWLKRGSKNLFILLRYLLGADPEKLVRSYRSAPKETQNTPK
ncbi:MAG: TIGR04283 family arsenosugar biosynthesis glycosyltransferase [Pseudomonadota bacterium]